MNFSRSAGQSRTILLHLQLAVTALSPSLQDSLCTRSKQKIITYYSQAQVPVASANYPSKPSPSSLLGSARPLPPSSPTLVLPPPPSPLSPRNYGPSVIKSCPILDGLYQLNSRMSDSGSMMSLQAMQRDPSSQKRNTSYIPGQRSGKWTDLEHMKYIVFIDFNKERMRSKEKRRSNKFYQEMADFIETRNALQCRSHHQKLEEKYSHAPKIVNVFKPAFERAAYRQALDALHSQRRDSSSQKSAKEQGEGGSRDMETQTEIGGLNLQFIVVNPQYILIQPRGFPYVPQPSYYYNPFYSNHYQQEHSSPSLPTSDLIPSSSWDSRPFSFDFGSN